MVTTDDECDGDHDINEGIIHCIHSFDRKDRKKKENKKRNEVEVSI